MSEPVAPHDFLKALDETTESYLAFAGPPWNLVVSKHLPPSHELATHRAQINGHHILLIDSCPAQDTVQALERDGVDAVVLDGGLISQRHAMRRCYEAVRDVAGVQLITTAPRPDTILLAEDNLPMARVIGLVLARQGIRLVHAETGDEAIQHLDTLAPSNTLMLFFDRHMPGLDGLDLLDLLDKREDWRDVPLWMCSAADGAEFLDRSNSRSPDGFLRKPFRPPELLNTVREAVRHRLSLLATVSR